MPQLPPTRQLGQNGPHVTALGYGTMGLSCAYGPLKPDEERLKLLSDIYDRGELFWDSADCYADSEDLLGQWFKQNPGKRENIFLATKFGIEPPNANGEIPYNSTPGYARQACDKSLSRLGLTHIDLYYCHRCDLVTPIEKTIEAMAELKKEGKIKYLGLSEVSADTLRRAHKVHPISAVQVEYSPFSLDIEHPDIQLLKAARELGVAVVAYSPMGRGMVTGEIRSPADFADDDFRKFVSRFSEENFPKNLQLTDKIIAIAKKKGVTPAQITLAWLMAQGNDIIPIPGTTKLSRFEENFAALDVKLTDAEEHEIRTACENADIKGQRYPEDMMANLLVESAPL